MNINEKRYGYDLPERQIMINSKFIYDEFPELPEILEKYESLNETAIKNMDEKIIKLMEREVIKNIYETAKKEWSAVKEGYDFKIDIYDKSEGKSCELCRQPNLVKVHYIKNKYSEYELEVGSDCIKRYEINVEISENQSREDFFKSQNKHANKIKRERIFNQHFPDAKNILRQWQETYERYELMIPSYLEEEFNQINSIANTIFNGFIKGVKNVKDIKEFENQLISMKTLQQKIERYIKESRDNEFIADKKIEKWLSDKHNGLYNNIKKEGKINALNFPYIHEKNFINKFLPKVKELIKDIEFNIKEVDFDSSTFVLVYDNLLNIQLNCKFKDLLELCGAYICNNCKIEEFNKENLKYEIANRSVILKGDSIENSILELKYKLNKNKIYIEEYSLKTDKAIIRYMNVGYKIVKLTDFTNIHKMFIIFGQEGSINMLLNSVKNGNLKSIDGIKSEIEDMRYFESLS